MKSILLRCLLPAVVALAFQPDAPAQGARAQKAAVRAQQVTVVFTNNTNKTVRVFSTGPKGTPVELGTLVPGQAAPMKSLPGQEWIFNSGGKQMGTYTATEKLNQRFTLGGKKG